MINEMQKLFRNKELILNDRIKLDVTLDSEYDQKP